MQNLNKQNKAEEKKEETVEDENDEEEKKKQEVQDREIADKNKKILNKPKSEDDKIYFLKENQLNKPGKQIERKRPKSGKPKKRKKEKKKIHLIKKKSKKKKKLDLEEAIDIFLECCPSIEKEILVDTLLILFDCPINKTMIKKGKFTKSNLLNYLKKNLLTRFKLLDDQYNNLIEKLINIFEIKAGIDLLNLNLDLRYETADVLYNTRKRNLDIVYSKFKKLINNQIQKSIDNLDKKSKEILYVYLKYFLKLQQPNVKNDLEDFPLLIEVLFKNKVIINNLEKILIKSHLYNFCEIDRFISRIYQSYIIKDDVLNQILRKLTEEISLKSFTREKLIEFLGNKLNGVAAVKYLLERNYYPNILKKCNRNDLRDYLFSIEESWWKSFRDDYLDNENPLFLLRENQIFLSPFINIEELKKVIFDWKKKYLTPYKQKILEILYKNLEIVDDEIIFNDTKGWFAGKILTSEKKSINIFLSLWYPEDIYFLGDETYIIFLCGYDTKSIEEIYNNFNLVDHKNVILIKIKKQNLEIISRPINLKLFSEIEDIFKKNNYKIISFLEEDEFIGDVEESGIGKDFLMDLGEKIFKSQKPKFPTEISSNRPYLILLPIFKDEDFSRSLQIICREIFKKFTKKGLPIPKFHDDVDSMKKYLKGESHIEFIKDNVSNVRIFCLKQINQKIVVEEEKELANRIEEFYSRGFGFVIFQIPKDRIADFKKDIENLTSRPEIIVLEPQLIKTVKKEKKIYIDEFEDIERDYLHPIELKKEIASIFWGWVEPKEDSKWNSGVTFDDFFCACEREFWKKLDQIFDKTSIKLNDENIIIKNDKKIQFDENAGPVHKGLKILTIKHLIENGKIDWGNIETEKIIQEGNVKADILVKNVEPYEIETFYGRGDRPDHRIEALIKEYQKKTKLSKLYVVISNLDAILWYKKFSNIKKYFKKMENFDIKFLTADLKNLKLIGIKELESLFIKKVEEYIKIL